MLPLLTRFSTQNSTLHGVQEGWENEPAGRGTWSILWTCLATLWICAYSVNRYDVQIRPIGLGLKILCFLQTLIAPEYTCYMALQDFLEANKLKSWIKQRKDIEGSAKWTLRHSFFFAMGGVTYYRYDESKHSDLLSWSHAANDDEGNEMRIFTQEKCIEYVTRYRSLPALISDGRIAAFSKSSWLLSLIAILQTSCTALQGVTRASLGLGTAPLELLTISYIPVFLATAILCWKKPLLEASVLTIPVTSQFDDRFRNLEPDNAGTKSTSADDGVKQSSQKHFRSLPFLLQLHFGGIFPGLILCGLHLLAWNNSFPTKAESIIWRVCCFVSIASCLLYGFCFVVYHTRWLQPILKITWIRRGGDEILLVLPYTFARLILIILAFLSLRSMPSGVYETIQWTQYLPHIH
jgi:hypothetical protein